jgi:RNA-directed DNA polymerase
MFLKESTRFKDGKEHHYWSLVENRRVDGGGRKVVQRHVRVLASVAEFLEKQLKLQVNRPKSAVGPVRERKFLGYRLLEGGALGVAPQSQEKLKGDLRELTRRNGGQSLEQVIGAVNEKLTGWIQYFHLARMKSVLEDLSQWLRRRVRSLKLKQCRLT